MHKEFKQLSPSYTTVFTLQSLSKTQVGEFPVQYSFHYIVNCLNLLCFIPLFLKVATNIIKQMLVQQIV